MPRIYVTPSQNSYKKTGGLCGMWNDDKNKDLYILDDQGNEKFGASVAEVKDFWRYTLKKKIKYLKLKIIF